MHKVKKRKKKANIIIETNKAISWVKSSINDGLNKKSNLLGKINPKCTLLPSPNWVVLNPVFSRVCRVCSLLCCAKLKQTAESCILFFSYFTKKQFLLQFRLSSWPRGVASTVGRGINPVIASAMHALTVKHSTFTMQPVHYHYKNNRSNIWKNTLLSLNM